MKYILNPVRVARLLTKADNFRNFYSVGGQCTIVDIL